MGSAYITPSNDVAPEFSELIIQVSRGRPNARVSQTDVRAAAIVLGDLSLETIRRGYERAVREVPGAGLPSPADVRRLAVGTADDSALVAWSGLCAAVRDAGAYASIEIADGAAALALEAVWGSWGAFCAEPEGPGLAQRRQEFLAAYRRVRRAGEVGPRRLAGVIEAGGAPAGSAVPVAAIGSGGLIGVRVIGGRQGGVAQETAEAEN